MTDCIGILEKNIYMASVLEQCNLIYKTFPSAEALYASHLPVIFCDELCNTETNSFLFTNHRTFAITNGENAIEQAGFYFAMEDSVLEKEVF